MGLGLMGRGDLTARPRLCAWIGMAPGMRSAPQVSAKGELHTSPATGGAMWAASPYSALCTDSTGCQDGSAQAEESVSRCGMEERSVLSFVGERR